MRKIEISKHFNIKKLLIAILTLLVANIFIFTTIWVMNKYDAIRIDQFLYQMKSSSVGVDRGLTKSIVFMVGMASVIFTIFEVFIHLILSGSLKFHFKKFSLKNISHCHKFTNFLNKRALTITFTVLIVSVIVFMNNLHVLSYISTTTTDSKFIEENYVDPDLVKITFPAKKRNLIHIYLESMESTYADSTVYPLKHNYIRELTALANKNVHFSNTSDNLGGALPFSGTTWTAASMVSQTSGVVVKVPLIGDLYGDESSYLPNLTNLGDILKENGYTNKVLMGSDARFADRNIYFRDHGDYEILDIISLKEQGRLPEDYLVWWGFEDEKLIEFAKEELTKLGKQEEPFNFTMLTADTHFPDGLMCEDCKEEFESQYANVLACSSKRIYDFISWLEKQDFYDNTTIVITGDHLTMDPNFLEGIDENYVRTTYNTIINSPVIPYKTTERLFGTFDMFPTTLASLGVTIEGERLGLGTNLFSKEQTLTEMYGFQVLDEELQKKSEFYNTEFFIQEDKRSIFNNK